MRDSLLSKVLIPGLHRPTVFEFVGMRHNPQVCPLPMHRLWVPVAAAAEEIFSKQWARGKAMNAKKSSLKCVLILLILAILVPGCSKNETAETPTTPGEAEALNIVKRSYQYVAMYNVIQKHAFDPATGSMFMNGLNNPVAGTTLLDHTTKAIARPNNDTFYQGVVLDLWHDAVIVDYPAIDSQYAVLEISGYSHYCGVPLASSEGDFKEPARLLFYSDRTRGYQGQQVEGVDEIVKVDGDFLFAFLRAMPHLTDPARMARIVEALKSVKVQTLAEYQGKPVGDLEDIEFPAYGKTDADVFAGNLLEVMQFVFNHTTFDQEDPMDQAVLAAYKPLGVEPGKEFAEDEVAELDGEMFRRIAAQVAEQALAASSDPGTYARAMPKLFLPKGKIDLETQVIQSVTGPIGLPAYQAVYIPAATSDGKAMVAQHDYVMRMSPDELPPATAFWSLTLYDLENGFFIPNDRKKYSVGENAGFQLNDEGGIEIYVSAEKPANVPEENWLPINRGDVGLNGMFRIYVPDAERMKTWKTPQFERLEGVD
jgi:hypothetical protein